MDLDVRHYTRIGSNGVFALRARGFKSWGDSPDFIYFGGNSELRGYNYLQFLGSERRAFAQRGAALPAHRGDVDAARRARRRARRVLRGRGRRPLRGTALAASGQCGTNLAALNTTNANTYTTTNSNPVPYTWFTTKSTIECPITTDAATGLPVLGAPIQINGFRLVDARAA